MLAELFPILLELRGEYNPDGTFIIIKVENDSVDLLKIRIDLEMIK